MVIGDPKDPAPSSARWPREEHFPRCRATSTEVARRRQDPHRRPRRGLGRQADDPRRRACRRPRGQEEIFGPVVVVTPFDTEAEAVALANGTPYGLNAMVFTENLTARTGCRPR
jgi:aminomuconate-semialdehyde/2-hydroxymuconate-6-semialdehyde dehydrogenase